MEPTFAEAKGDLGGFWCSNTTKVQLAEGLKLAREGAEEDGSPRRTPSVGSTLAVLDQRDEAIAEFRRGVRGRSQLLRGPYQSRRLFRVVGAFRRGHGGTGVLPASSARLGLVHLHIGTLLAKQGKIDDAIAELTVATRQDAQSIRASAHAALGDCWRTKGSLQLALMEYDQARLLIPGGNRSLCMAAVRSWCNSGSAWPLAPNGRRL